MAGITAVTLLIMLAWDAGGYFPPSYLAAGAVAFGVLGLLLIAAPPHYRISTRALVALAALAAYAFWTGLSTRWSSAPDTGLAATQRDLAYVALFGLALVAAGSGRLARHLVWAVLLAIVVVVSAGLISRFYPDVISSPTAPLSAGGYRLAYPLSYWNAFGALGALGAVLALGLAADPRAAVPLRAAAAGGAVLAATAMYLSLSRGAWLALFVGLIVLVLMGAHRGSLLLSAAVVGGATLLAVSRLQSYPALTDNPHADGGQLSSGHAYAPQMLALVAAAIVVQGLIAAGRASPPLMSSFRRVMRPVGAAIAAIVLVVGIVAYVVEAGAIEGHGARWLDDSSHFVSRQWNDFLRPTAFSQGGTARLTTTKGTRSDIYRVALDGFAEHPLRGEGAGSFEYRWIRHRRVDENVRNAHSLYLETLDELGLVGGILLLVFIGSLIAAALRSRLRSAALSRSQTAAVAAACSVWIAHSAVDWDWQMSALTGAALVLAASLYPFGRRPRGRKNAGVGHG